MVPSPMKVLLLLLARPSLAVSPGKVHLIDTYPRIQPHNYLFRGNNPVVDGTFNFTALVNVMRQKAAAECGVALPEAFRFVDLSLENPTDPGYFQEKAFWDANPRAGELDSYPTLGSLQDVKHPVGDADELVKSGDWAIQGHADYLPERLAAVHASLTNTSGPPTIFYAHCNAGCDRTGEFFGAYAMSYLGYNVTTAMGEACKQCGRCPNYYATNSIGWWCLTLEAQGRTDVGPCLDFASCKPLGDCTARNATPLEDDCPRLGLGV